MPSFFFQMQSSCTFYTCMHFLLIISLVIALIPIFHANYTVHHIKKYAINILDFLTED